MFKSTFAIIFALSGLVSTISVAQDRNVVQTPPRITFAGLNRSDLDDGPFRIEGFVMQIYKCPPCPEGAQCKPCLGDYVVITDNLSEKDPALIKHLRIFNRKPEQFEVGKKYSFLVKVRGKIHEGRALEEVELISFETLETKPGS